MSSARRSALVVLLLLAVGACHRPAGRVPLPWHGPLTRVVRDDIGAGRLPEPTCSVAPGSRPRRAGIRRLLSVAARRDAFSCTSYSPDSMHQFSVGGRRGVRVDHYGIVVYEPLHEPTRLDSVYRALSGLHGEGQKCRVGGFFRDAQVVGAKWERRGFVITLHPGREGHSHHGREARFFLVEASTDGTPCTADDARAAAELPLGADLPRETAGDR